MSDTFTGAKVLLYQDWLFIAAVAMDNIRTTKIPVDAKLLEELEEAESEYLARRAKSS